MSGDISSGEHRRLRAEQALLGAVLSDPVTQAHLLDLVSRADMARPYHGQVLAAMRRLRGRGAVPGPLAVYEEIKKDPDLPRRLSHDGVLLAGLMEAAPRTDHAPAYVAMVVSSGIRQRIGLAASRMTQAADGPDLDAALAMADQAQQELGRCRARWEALPAPMRQELPLPTRSYHGDAGIARSMTGVRQEISRLRQDLLVGTGDGLEERLTSIAQQVADIAAASEDLHEQRELSRPAADARPVGVDAAAAGVQALRDLVASPSHLSAVREWLQPRHFARSGHGKLYAVMRDLASAGQPVDPVTVSWEASRRGIDIDAADLAGGVGPLAVASAREVQRLGLLAQVAAAGRDIQASADDPRLAPTSFLRSAGDRIRHMDSGQKTDGRSHDDWQPRDRRRAAGPAVEAEAGVA